MKTSRHFRLSDDALAILAKRSSALGISETAWLEMQIRAGDGLSKAGQAVMDSLPHFPDPESAFQSLGRQRFDPRVIDLVAEQNSLSPEASAQRKAKRETKAKRKDKLRQEVSAAVAHPPSRSQKFQPQPSTGPSAGEIQRTDRATCPHPAGNRTAGKEWRCTACGFQNG